MSLNSTESVHLNLRHIAFQGPEEERQNKLLHVFLGRLFQNYWQLLNQRHRSLDALRIAEHRPLKIRQTFVKIKLFLKSSNSTFNRHPPSVSHLSVGKMIWTYSSGLHSFTKNKTGSSTAANTSWPLISFSSNGHMCWNHNFCKVQQMLVSNWLSNLSSTALIGQFLPLECRERLLWVSFGKTAPFGWDLSSQWRQETGALGRRDHCMRKLH